MVLRDLFKIDLSIVCLLEDILGLFLFVINGADAVLHDFDYVEHIVLHHYISFCSLGYFVEISIRIVHLEKWFSGQMLKDNLQMPSHNI